MEVEGLYLSHSTKIIRTETLQRESREGEPTTSFGRPVAKMAQVDEG